MGIASLLEPVPLMGVKITPPKVMEETWPPSGDVAHGADEPGLSTNYKRTAVMGAAVTYGCYPAASGAGTAGTGATGGHSDLPNRSRVLSNEPGSGPTPRTVAGRVPGPATNRQAGNNPGT